MAKSDREGFKTVETDFDELDAKIRAHRKEIFHRVLWIVGIFAVLAVAAGLWMALRTYDSYEVRNTTDRTDSEASKFEVFLGNIIRYSNDGIVYMDSENEYIWNQSFEMTAPKISICENYLVVYDQGGLDIYIMDDSGLRKQIETTLPIQTVCVANQGSIAVLMKDSSVSYVKLYDRKGNELANGAFYRDKGGFPIDIALSADAQKLAVDMVDVSDGNVKSTITFYNFGSVGQNEINNNVGTYSYFDMLIPEIEYVSEDRMVAIGDTEIVVFGGSQKPEVTAEIFLTGELESVFYDKKYIGTVQSNYDEEGTHHIQVYDMRGKSIMEADTALAYDSIEFLSNHEICAKNNYECTIYTIHSIEKFSYTFDREIYKILPQGIGADYIFIMEGTTEEVRLQ
jgi:hypothetical protein